MQDLLNKEFQARKALAGSLDDLKTSTERLASMRTTAEQVTTSLEPQTLDLYVGTYEFPEAGGLTLSVTRAGNKLYAAQPGSTPQELLPLSSTRFFVPHGYDFYQCDFSPEAVDDQTYQLVLTIYGMAFTASRK